MPCVILFFWRKFLFNVAHGTLFTENPGTTPKQAAIKLFDFSFAGIFVESFKYSLNMVGKYVDEEKEWCAYLEEDVSSSWQSSSMSVVALMIWCSQGYWHCYMEDHWVVRRYCPKLPFFLFLPDILIYTVNIRDLLGFVRLSC